MSRISEAWLKDLKAEDLPEAHRKFAEVIGIEGTIAICGAFGGMYIYIPKQDTMCEAARRAAILREWREGRDTSTLARKYNVSQRYVQMMVNGIKDDSQLSLFEM